jgi:hypothetical protein
VPTARPDIQPWGCDIRTNESTVNSTASVFGTHRRCVGVNANGFLLKWCSLQAERRDVTSNVWNLRSNVRILRSNECSVTSNECHVPSNDPIVTSTDDDVASANYDVVMNGDDVTLPA